MYQASIHSKMAAASSRRVVQVCRSSNSRCRVPKNDSIIALSNEEPTRSIEPSKPAARSRWPKAYAVYCAPRSECTTVWPAGGRRQLGFDGMTLNERHNTHFTHGDATNVEAGILARITQRAKIVVLGNVP